MHARPMLRLRFGLQLTFPIPTSITISITIIISSFSLHLHLQLGAFLAATLRARHLTHHRHFRLRLRLRLHLRLRLLVVGLGLLHRLDCRLASFLGPPVSIFPQDTQPLPQITLALAALALARARPCRQHLAFVPLHATAHQPSHAARTPCGRTAVLPLPHCVLVPPGRHQEVGAISPRRVHDHLPLRHRFRRRRLRRRRRRRRFHLRCRRCRRRAAQSLRPQAAARLLLLDVAVVVAHVHATVCSQPHDRGRPPKLVLVGAILPLDRVTHAHQLLCGLWLDVERGCGRGRLRRGG
eukprot:scaffold17731_cov45-Phaeocystis_antarctica.AAC.2